MIMQPVLQYGKSGCILDPLDWSSWHWTSYLVSGSGRAHCGPHFKVDEGEVLVGNMTRTDSGSAEASAQSWVVTALRTKTSEASTLSTQLSLPAGAKVDGKLVEKGVRAYLRKVSDPASINRKELRSALEAKLGVDLAEWKDTIKQAAVAFVTNMVAAS